MNTVIETAEMRDVPGTEPEASPSFPLSGTPIEVLRQTVSGPTGAYSFNPPEPDAPDELLRRRYLTRGSLVLVSAMTGVGKSVFLYQSAILWSNGLPFLGFEPPRPLRVLVVQAENDDGEIANITNGIAAGCKLTDEQKAAANERCLFYHYIGALEANDLYELLKDLVSRHRADVLVLDPFFAFYVARHTLEEMSAFYRHMLNILARELQIGIIIVSHWPKPARQGQPRGSEYLAAYHASGFAEQGNTCRAVVSIEPVTKEPGVFQVNYGKRGQLLPRRVRYIRQSDNPVLPCWTEVPDELVARLTSDVDVVAERLMDALALRRVRGGAYLDKSAAQFGTSRQTLRTAVNQLVDQGLVRKVVESQGNTHVTYLEKV